MSISKITVDLRSRTFSVEIPDEQVDAVLSRIEALFHAEEFQEAELELSQGAEEQPTATGEAVQSKVPAPNPPAVRKRSKSSGAKVKAWEAVELGLTEAQRKGLREFYDQKAPKSQNEQVAVLAVQLKEMLGTSALGGNEIYSAFRLINQPTPKNLVAVFGNMKRDSRAGYKDNMLIVNSHTEDYVNHHMKKEA